MRRLTIITERYEKLLREFLRENDERQWSITSEGQNGNHFFIRLLYAQDGNFCGVLAALLEEAAALENPVYRCSPRLMDVARDLRGAPIHSDEMKRLAEFLKSNTAIHVEGYTAFRMGEFCYKLDLVAYGLIKKLRMTER